jgi:leucine dehydrogenase
MGIFGAADFADHERVVHVLDRGSGLRAIIAIHSTALGPALGGCRMHPYEDEAAALSDVLRLSRGMSYKAAIAGVRLGGGKSVIIGDPRRDKTEALLRAMGRAIEGCAGSYIVGEDIGTNPDDMRVMRRETHAVSCLDQAEGGYGDPAPMTALGVFQAILAAAEHRLGRADVRGLKVAVQGVGNVGRSLCRLLASAGAELTVCDTHKPQLEKVCEELSASAVGTDDIFSAEVDVFAPCAMGAILNSRTIPLLKAKVVAGAANNQLADAEAKRMLADRHITYVPDYVANCGGLISCAAEWYRTDPQQVRRDVLNVRSVCSDILSEAEAEHLHTDDVARCKAEARIAAQSSFGPAT